MNRNKSPRLRFAGFAGEWEEKTLGEFGKVEMCRRIFKEQTQPNGEIPFFKIGTFGQEPDAFISRELFEEYRQKYPYPKKGDILISAAGTIGRTVEFHGEDAYFQDSNIVWLRFDESQITASFLNLAYQNIQWDLEGSTIKRLYNSDLLSAEISLPCEPEQTALGDFFRRLDETLAQARARLAKTQQLKRAMLAKLFPAHGETAPKLRFQGFSGDWERKVLGEVADFAKGKGLSKSSIENGGQIPCILYGELYTKYGCCIDKVVSSTNANIENPTLSKSNDVLMPTSDVTPNGLAKACAIYLDDIVLGGDILVIRSNKMLGLFFAYFVESNPSAIIEKATGTTVFHIYAKDLMSVEIPMPSYEEQTAIGNFFQKLDQTLALQSAALEKLTRLKKALLAAMLV